MSDAAVETTDPYALKTHKPLDSRHRCEENTPKTDDAATIEFCVKDPKLQTVVEAIAMPDKTVTYCVENYTETTDQDAKACGLNGVRLSHEDHELHTHYINAHNAVTNLAKRLGPEKRALWFFLAYLHLREQLGYSIDFAQQMLHLMDPNHVNVETLAKANAIAFANPNKGYPYWPLVIYANTGAHACESSLHFITGSILPILDLETIFGAIIFETDNKEHNSCTCLSFKVLDIDADSNDLIAVAIPTPYGETNPISYLTMLLLDALITAARPMLETAV